MLWLAVEGDSEPPRHATPRCCCHDAQRATALRRHNILLCTRWAVLQGAVIGLTTRHDVLELLEKRVKSR